jgi:hypothetical protein
MYWNKQTAYYRDHVACLNHNPNQTTFQELAGKFKYGSRGL